MTRTRPRPTPAPEQPRHPEPLPTYNDLGPYDQEDPWPPSPAKK